MQSTEKINNAIKWIDTLVENKYKQGKGQLGDDASGYCCLGVGCVVTNTEFLHHDMTSEEFTEKVGLCGTRGEPNGKPLWSLTWYNDSKEYTFPQIADILIQHPDEYFIDKVARGIKEHYTKEL